MNNLMNIFLVLVVAFLVYYIYMSIGGDLKEGYIFPGATQCDDVCRLACWGYPEYCKSLYLDHGVAGCCGCRWNKQTGMGESSGNRCDKGVLYAGGVEKWLADTGKKMDDSLIYY